MEYFQFHAVSKWQHLTCKSIKYYHDQNVVSFMVLINVSFDIESFWFIHDGIHLLKKKSFDCKVYCKCPNIHLGHMTI